MLFQIKHVVMDHLGRFGILKHKMLLLYHRLHEVLMDWLAEAPPRVSVLHNEQMVATSDEVVRNE